MDRSEITNLLNSLKKVKVGVIGDFAWTFTLKLIEIPVSSLLKPENLFNTEQN